MASKKAKDERFEKFGMVSFTAATKVNDFIDHLSKGCVAGTRCNICGEHFFPPRADCFCCMSSDMSWFTIGSSGSLVSYSELKFAPRGFEDDLPYSLALLDFEKYKVFGRLDDSVDLSNIAVGTKMKILVKYLKNGQLSYVFQKDLSS